MTNCYWVMRANTYKTPQESSQRRSGLFHWVDRLLNLDTLLKEQHRHRIVPYLLFTATLAVVYIANRHYAERKQRQLIQLRREVNNLRTEYTTRKAAYMSLTRQSIVRQKARKIGLESGKKGPYLIRKP